MHLSPSHFGVILVRPQLPENVGAAARSMKAFGFGQLILVNPGFSWEERGAAYKTASGAGEIVEQARIYPTLEESLADYHQAAGFSRRGYAFPRAQWDLPGWIHQLQADAIPPKTALVFGPEDYGLSNAERNLCHHLVRIPTSVETLSLNLAHAVTVVLYEISNTRLCPRAAEPSPPSSKNTPATHADLERVLRNAVELLDSTPFFKSGRREQQVETLRFLIQRLALTSAEYEMVMGTLQALRQAIPGR
ncbi:MAG: RNA methyltransferase [bacterium]